MARIKKHITDEKSEVSKYYSLKNILQKNADYNIIFGERSNGKTYAALKLILQNFLNGLGQGAYIRRWREDLRGKRGETLFNALIVDGTIESLTNGEYNSVTLQSGKYYLCKVDGKDRELHSTPFCYSFALSEQEHEKSTSYPNVTSIVFDEFLTRRYYLPDEFMLFMNLLSTIIRQRDGVKIFMLGNTVNKYCPYFSEFGLKQIPTMKQGTIDLYQFGADGCKIAVEYAAATAATEKKSNKYFSFDNQNLQMIKGGKWEVDVYPHLPCKYAPKDIVFTYYIDFDGVLLQCEIIQFGNNDFTYIHAKTTPIKDTVNSLIYSLEQHSTPNYKRKLLSAATDLEKKVARYYATDKVFFQSNEIGEIVRNYIICSAKSNVLTV